MIRCKNCSFEFSGRFCPACGQKVIGRFNRGYLWQQIHSELLEVDKGAFYTMKGLFFRPGRMIGEYLGGKTRIYYGPLKYLLIWVTVWYLLFAVVGIFDDGSLPDWREELSKARTAGSTEEGFKAFNNASSGLLMANLTAYFLLLIPCLAISARLFFRQLNLVEHMITIAYIWGQGMLYILVIGVLLSLPLGFMSDQEIILVWLIGMTAVFLLALFAFFTVTYQQLTGGTFFRTMIRVIPAIVLGYLVLMGAAALVFFLLRAMV